MAEGEFRNRWRVELEGDQNVRQKLDALLTLQQKGLRATNEEIAAGRQAATSINSVTRAQTALIRSWQASHPQLSLMVRGLSSLAAIGRTVVNIITSINVMQLRQIEAQRNLREAQQDVINKQQLYNDALREFGADHPETVKRMQELNAALEELSIITKQMDTDKLQDIGLGIGNILTALGAVGQIGTSIALFRTLGVSMGVAAAAMAAFVGSIVVLGALIVLTNDQFDALLKTLGLFDIVYAIDATWQDFKQDWIEIFGILSAVVMKFDINLQKHLQILTIRARRWFEDLWERIVSVFTNGTKKALDQINKWGADIIKYFQDLYKKIVGGSIIPEMMDQINTVVAGGLASAEDKFQKFGLNVTDTLTKLGDRVGNILINDFQRATDAVSRIDDIARTRSLTKAERQQLHEAQVSQHVLSGAAGGGRVGRAGMFAGGQSQLTSIGPGDPFYNAYGSYLQAAYPGEQSRQNIQNRIGRGDIFQANQGDIESARAWAQRSGLTIIVQGSLITERELISKVSEAIAQAV